MSLLAYKVIHLVGLMLLFGGIGGLAVVGGIGADPARAKPFKAILNAFHGLGLVLLAFGGFGLLAKLGIAKPGAWGGWVYAKFGLWLVFGAAVVPLKRMPTMTRLWLLVFVALGAVTGYLALYKPF